MKNILFLIALPLSFAQCLTTKSTPSSGNGTIQAVEIFGVPKPTSPYNLGVWAGDNFYLAGQLGTDPISGKMPEGGFKAEAHGVMKNLERILKSGGLDFSNVVKTTVYLTDLNDFQTLNEVYKTYFPKGYYPVRETVQVAGLVRGAHIEISMVAYKKR
jgi:2-iminobutanoate/2-iminopropanoate deaminase